MKKAAVDTRYDHRHHNDKISHSRKSTGSVTGKYPVILHGGKTIIYISDKSREQEIRSKYEH